MPPHDFADYSEIVLDHFDNPRNVGTVENPDAVGRATNPSCGDQLLLTLRVVDGRIAQARFRASGCAAAIASSSMTTVLLEGRTLEEASSLSNESVAEAMGGLPQAKLHCSVLAEEAIRAALQDHAGRLADRGGRPSGGGAA